MHLVAALTAVGTLRLSRVATFCRVDIVFGMAVALGGLSSTLAPNPWWALRSFGLTFSGLVLFWLAGQIDSQRDQRRLLGWLAAATVTLSVLMIIEAAGLLPTLSMPGRSPGATSGNRNFAAHLLVLGLPLVAERVVVKGGFWWPLALAVMLGAILLTRARIAWIGGGAAIFTAILGAVIARRWPSSKRLALLGVGALGGIAVCVHTGNASWKTAAPYRDTLARIVDLEQGTGRGRIIQYQTTLSMIEANPILGVGPGNWSVKYPIYASLPDPSWTPDDIQQVNRLPSSDWLGAVSERGIPALLLVTSAGALLGMGFFRRLATARTKNEQPIAPSMVGVVTLVSSAVMGIGDAVLLRPEPMYLCAVVLGCTASSARRILLPSRSSLQLALCILIVIGAMPHTVLAGSRVISAYARRSAFSATRELAARLDPGDYVFATVLAIAREKRGDCWSAVRLAQRASAVYPHSQVLEKIARRCERRTNAVPQPPLHR